MKPAPFDYRAPQTVAEALSVYADLGPDAKLLAGGQSLLPLLGLRMAAPTALVDLGRVAELGHHRIDNGELVVGAMCRHRDIELDESIRSVAPIISEAVSNIGHVAIRNRGTVGGSIAHSDPTAEWTVLAMLLGAKMIARSRTGTREIAAADFFAGFLENTLQPGEILVEIRFPLPAEGTHSAFVELARRHGDFAICAAGSLVGTDDRGRMTSAQVAVSGAAPAAVRLPAVEELLVGEQPSEQIFEAAGKLAAEGAKPQADLHGDVDYHRRLVGVIVKRSLQRALSNEQANSK